MESGTAVLERIDARQTSPRRAVTEAALRRDQPFSAGELVDELTSAGVGRATVFRTLELLVRAGVLARLHAEGLGERCARYTRCAPEHHHHLICRACGRVDEIDAAGIELQVRSLAASRGFRALSHSLEIQGLCPRCAG